VVEPIICKYGTLTADGGRSSSTRTSNSSTSTTRRSSKSKETKMEKETQLEYTATTEATTKSGLLFTLIKLERLNRKDSTLNGASIEIDHSTSDPECQ
jgi:hypothetical protein